MSREYQLIGLVESVITSNPVAHTADPRGFMQIECLADGAISLAVLTHPRGGGISQDGNVTMTKGMVLRGLASFTIDSGQYQIWWFKS